MEGRAFSSDCHNAKWIASVQANDHKYDVEIKKWFYSTEEAEEFEATEIYRLKPVGNTRIPSLNGEKSKGLDGEHRKEYYQQYRAKNRNYLREYNKRYQRKYLKRKQ